MADAVVVFKNGDRMSGEYDGYGCIGDTEISDHEGEMAIYHRACWEISGKPEFSVPSRPARDQGYFVGKYDPAKPKTVKSVAALKAKMTKQIEAARKKREAARLRDVQAVRTPIPFWFQPVEVRAAMR